MGMLVATAAALAAAQPYDYGPASGAQGADVKAQLRTAIQHAGFAAAAGAISGVEQHLGHALNCIEGTRGRNFNQAWGHVCQGQGNGILADLRTAQGGADLMLVAQHADELAVAGVKSKNLNEARNAARGVAALLTVISENLK